MKKVLSFGTLSLIPMLLLFTQVNLSSCTKDTVTTVYDTTVVIDTINASNTLSPYYVKATINGTNIVYKGFTQAINRYIGFLSINGNNNSDTSSDGIQIYFQNSNSPDYAPTSYTPIITGTYTDTATQNIDGYWNPYIAYLNLQLKGTLYSSIPHLDNTTPFIGTITTLSNSSISGTFSGKAYYADDDNSINADTAVITNGSFYVPF
jgi:hypothetical protein